MPHLHKLTPTPRQEALGNLVRETAYRHYEAHGRWPACVFASEAWFDEMAVAAPMGTTCLLVGGVPVVACMGLSGVSVMSRV